MSSAEAQITLHKSTSVPMAHMYECAYRRRLVHSFAAARREFAETEEDVAKCVARRFEKMRKMQGTRMESFAQVVCRGEVVGRRWVSFCGGGRGCSCQ